MKKVRPPLQKIPWPEEMKGVMVTMSVGQWDALLWSFYKAGAILLELDENEQPVQAYQMKPNG